jgi:hypothetical protein
LANDNFELTDTANGVDFRVGQRFYYRVSWTKPDSDDAWLALDRDRNGTIDTGEELFGNLTPQPEPPTGQPTNGFFALAEFDRPVFGGNGDRRIDRLDQIFRELRLWTDRNHNGLSESTELATLQVVGVAAIDLDYKLSNRQDRYRNKYRYRANLHSDTPGQIGKWVYDVLLRVSRRSRVPLSNAASKRR